MSRTGDDVAEDDRDDEVVEEARLRQQAIGVKLRHMFDDIVSEPVPEEFLDILRRADGAPPVKTGGGGGSGGGQD